MRKKFNTSELIEIPEIENNIKWVQLNIENAQQVWRLEQARESVSLRSIFDRQWIDIYEKRTSTNGVIIDKNNR